MVLALAGLLRWFRLDAYTGSFDEGIRSQQLLLMSAGYRPFRDVFSSQGPLLLDLLYPFYLLFGQTLEAARAGVAIFSMIGLVGAWLTARAIAGPVAGVAVLGILLVSPGYLEGSRLALAEVPTIAPALLAIAALLAYRRGGDRRWLAASAALCALALLIKPMVIHVGVPLLALLAAPMWRPPCPRRPGWLPAPADFRSYARQAAIDLALYGAVVGVLCGGTVLALGPAQVWDNLGAYRAGAGSGLGSDLAENLRLTASVMARERIGFVALAAAGLVLGLWRRPVETAAIGAWSGAVLAFFGAYGDLADKHVVYLVPPLALLGAIGTALTVELACGLWESRPREGRLRDAGPRAAGDARSPRWLGPAIGAAIGAVGLAAYVTQLPRLYQANRYLIYDAEEVAIQRRNRPAELDMAQVMRERAAPGDWVLSDNPGAAFRARRLTIPALVDTSGTRVDAGSLTSAKAAAAVAQYRPAVVVTWRGRLGKLDEFVRGLPAQGYRLDRTYEDGWRLYVRG